MRSITNKEKQTDSSSSSTQRARLAQRMSQMKPKPKQKFIRRQTRLSSRSRSPLRPSHSHNVTLAHTDSHTTRRGSRLRPRPMTPSSVASASTVSTVSTLSGTGTNDSNGRDRDPNEVNKLNRVRNRKPFTRNDASSLVKGINNTLASKRKGNEKAKAPASAPASAPGLQKKSTDKAAMAMTSNARSTARLKRNTNTVKNVKTTFATSRPSTAPPTKHTRTRTSKPSTGTCRPSTAPPISINTNAQRVSWSTTVEEAQVLTPRQIELRRFIENERLARMHEREMKLLHSESISAELSQSHSNAQAVAVVQAPSDTRTPTCTPFDADESCQSNSKQSDPSTSSSTNHHGKVLKDLSANTTIATETQYEGPPAMDEDEPTYSTIKKKMSSPVQLKKRNFTFTHRSTIVGTHDLEAVEDSVEMVVQNMSEPLQSSSNTIPLEKTDKLHQTKIKPQHISSSTAKTTNSFFFVPIQDYEEPQHIPKTVPTIILGTFAESAWLEFGDDTMNIVGESKSLPFNLHVPEDSTLDVFGVQVERVPSRKGFTLGLACDQNDTPRDIDENDGNNEVDNGHDNYGDGMMSTFFTVKRGEKKRLFLTWTPVAPGGVCEVVYLKLKRGRVRVTARGHARGKETKELKKATKIEQRVHAKGCTRTSRQPKQDSTMPKVASIPRNFATKMIPNHRPQSTYSKASPPIEIDSKMTQRSWSQYNDECSVQQCEAYTKWLNHIFQNPEVGNDECEHTQNLEPLTLRAVSLHRRRAQANQRAQHLFNSEEMQSMKNVIGTEVRTKRLSIRTDHDAFANVNLRSQIISLLMSYSTPWLRLGLETIFGEAISIGFAEKSMQGQARIRVSLGIIQADPRKITMRTAVKRFILDRVLSEPRLKMKYTGGKCNIPSGRFERRYRKELNDHILKKILLLVVFLDGARLNNVIGSSVRLFNKNGLVKSSREFLHILCRDFIHGIGNLIKYLSQKGVHVSFEQNPLEELEFSVSNLAIDLRDGVRLGKLAEVLGNSYGILEQMRLPAISRLQKVHNVGIALSALAKLDIPTVDKIHPNYIVDGHRPQVLKMLWSIMTSFKLCTLLDQTKLKQEIYSIHRSNKSRRQLIKFSRVCGDIECCDDTCDLLLVLCQAICSPFGCEVKNFSTSFADGRVICLLIHQYHPNIVRLCDILPTCSDVYHSSSSDKVTDPETIHLAVHNERDNCIFASEKMLEIGGIPNMFPISDTYNVPDERATIICIAYLFARLFELSREFNAAAVIKKSYKNYQRRKRGNRAIALSERPQVNSFNQCSDMKCDVADIAHSTLTIKCENISPSTHEIFPERSKQRPANTFIQKTRLGEAFHKTNDKIIDHAATLIQKVCRGFLCLRAYYYRLYSITKLQSVFRMSIAMRTVHKRKACTARRRLVAKRFIRTQIDTNYQHDLIHAVVLCQSLVRRKIAIARRRILLIQMQRQSPSCSSFCEGERAVTVIPSTTRTFEKENRSASLVQSWWRCILLRSQFIRYKARMIIMQSIVRTFLTRKKSSTVNHSALTIQCAFRRYQALGEASSSPLCRVEESSKRQPQTHHRQHPRCTQDDESAIIIQKHWRRFSANLKFRFDLSDIVFIQSLVRRRLAMALFHSKKKVSPKQVQSMPRVRPDGDNDVETDNCEEKETYFTVQSEEATKDSITFTSASIIQKNWRRYVAITDYIILIHARLTIQAWVCSVLQRKNWKKSSTSKSLTSSNTNVYSDGHIAHVRIIQQWWRTRKRQVYAIHAITTPQKHVRGGIARHHSYLDHVAASEIQRVWRGFGARESFRNNLDLYHFAASEIQRIWRGYNVHIDYMLSVASAKRVQRRFRSYLTRELMNKRDQDVLAAGLENEFLDTEKCVRKSSVADDCNIGSRHLVHADAKSSIVTCSTTAEIVSKSIVAGTSCEGHPSKNSCTCSNTPNQSAPSQRTIRLSAPEEKETTSTDFQGQSVYDNGIQCNSIASQSTHVSLIHENVSPFTSTTPSKKVNGMLLGEQRALINLSIIENASTFKEHDIDTGISRIDARSNERSASFPNAYESKYKNASVLRERDIDTAISRIDATSKERSASFPTAYESKYKKTSKCSTDIAMMVENRLSSLIATRAASSEGKSTTLHTQGKSKYNASTRSKLKIGLMAEKRSAYTIPPRFSNLDKKELLTQEKSINEAGTTQHFRSLAKSSCESNSKQHSLQGNVPDGPLKEVEKKSDDSLPSCEMESPVTLKVLHVLQKSTKLSEIMEAIKKLESSTQLSYSCCKAFADTETPEILYDVIRSCNRSIPHTELLQFLLDTFSNVSKHDNLIASITNANCVDTLVDVIQLFRDKDEIFCTAALILKRIVINDYKFLVLCRKKENMKRLLGVYELRKNLARFSKKSVKEGSTGIQILGTILETCMSNVFKL